MKKEKKIAVGSLAIVSATLVTLAAVSLPKFINAPAATEDPNQITFTSNVNLPTFDEESTEMEEDSNFISNTKVHGGNTFAFKTNGIKELSGAWGSLPTGAYLRNYGEVLNDLDELVITTKDQTNDAKIRVYFARNNSQYSDYYSRDYTIGAAGQTIKFEGHPGYFKMVVTDGTLNIASMDLKYSCDGTVTKTWDENLGAAPYYLKEVEPTEYKMISFGAYPQFHVDYSDEQDSLYQMIKAQDSKYADDQYIYCENNFEQTKIYPYYMRYGKESGTDNNAYYCVSVLYWNYVEDSGNDVKVFDCAKVIENKQYNSGEESSPVYFRNSSLKKWLNKLSSVEGSGEFYKQAFALNNSIMETQPVVDPDGTIYNKVCIPEKDQLVKWYKSGALQPTSRREKKGTDFAFAKGLKREESVEPSPRSQYWTRSATGEGNLYCDYDGSIPETKYISPIEELGVSPTISLKGVKFE